MSKIKWRLLQPLREPEKLTFEKLGFEEGTRKLHYFNQDEADKSDMLLGMAKMQGYVPETCLLSGAVVMMEVKASRNPCNGCAGPREKCKGSRRKSG